MGRREQKGDELGWENKDKQEKDKREEGGMRMHEASARTSSHPHRSKTSQQTPPSSPVSPSPWLMRKDYTFAKCVAVPFLACILLLVLLIIIIILCAGCTAFPAPEET